MQSLQDSKTKGSTGKVITHSPYGASRNVTYGWSSIFGRPPQFAARVKTKNVHQRLYIGTSSLNSVPDGCGSRGGKDRSFKTLLSTYGQKFGALEHCYPFHRLSTIEEWSEWRRVVATIHGGSRELLGSTPRRMGDFRLQSPNISPLMCSRKESSARGGEQEGEKASAIECSSLPESCTRTPSASSSCDAMYTNNTAPPEGIPTFYVDPSRFLLTIKANKYLTHELQLQCDTEEAVRHVHFFFHELCRVLDPYLGPILIQLPPSFERSTEHVQRLRRLYQLLPHDEIILVYPVSQSVTSSTSHGSCASAPAPLPCYSWERRRRIRIAVEFRHSSWYHPETFRLFREFQWAIVVSDYPSMDSSRSGRNAFFGTACSSEASAGGSAGGGLRPFIVPLDTGVPFLYCRFHGAVEKCAGDYGAALLQGVADRFSQFLAAVDDENAARESFPPHRGERGSREAEAGVPPSRTAVTSSSSNETNATWVSSSVAPFTSAAELYSLSLSSSCAASAPYREVFCFFNNNDSHIQHVTSSVVDGSCLAKLLRDRWEASFPSPCPSFSRLGTTSVTGCDDPLRSLDALEQKEEENKGKNGEVILLLTKEGSPSQKRVCKEVRALTCSPGHFLRAPTTSLSSKKEESMRKRERSSSSFVRSAPLSCSSSTTSLGSQKHFYVEMESSEEDEDDASVIAIDD